MGLWVTFCLLLCLCTWTTGGYVACLHLSKFREVKLYISPERYTQYYLAGDVRCITYI
ncbi:MAG: hypothetical protein H0Z16_07725 [Thermodesulfobacterium sp.]|nr:hypothetical protein [Thermodesulfobacterium sp.]